MWGAIVVLWFAFFSITLRFIKRETVAAAWKLYTFYKIWCHWLYTYIILLHLILRNSCTCIVECRAWVYIRFALVPTVDKWRIYYIQSEKKRCKVRNRLLTKSVQFAFIELGYRMKVPSGTKTINRLTLKGHQILLVNVLSSALFQFSLKPLNSRINNTAIAILNLNYSARNSFLLKWN